MEEFLYEARPYYCLALALVGFTLPETVGRISGLVLGYCGVRIWLWRREYRGHYVSAN